MPASMISAPTGGRPNVIGSSIAMVASGPTPGNTPIRVPTSAPIRHMNRFIGVSETLKPRARLCKRSIMGGDLRCCCCGPGPAQVSSDGRQGLREGGRIAGELLALEQDRRVAGDRPQL